MDPNQSTEPESQVTTPPSDTTSIPIGIPAVAAVSLPSEPDSATEPVLELSFNEPDSPSNIEYDPADGTKIKLCTFAKLIEKLTSPKKDDVNQHLLLHEVMLTYHSFCKSNELLNALIKRYETAPEGQERKVIHLRVFNVLKHWVDNHWHDFSQDESLVPILSQFLDRCQNDPSSKKPAEDCKKALNNRLQNKTKTTTYTPTEKPPRPILPRHVDDPLMEIDAEEIARQLTLIEWDLWVAVQPYECYGLAWMKPDKEKRAPNICALTRQFNYVSGWITTLICTTEDFKKRVNYVKKFLQIAKFLKKLGNLNAVMEVVSGLNRGPVARLEKTFDALDAKSKKKLISLKELTNTEKNYKAVREYLSTIDPPCIPYLGIFLTDLTFFEEGNPNFVGPRKLINFKKRRQTAETIRKIQQYQLKPYNLEPVEFIQKKLKSQRVLDDVTLYECSYYIEPKPGKERPQKPEAIGGTPVKSTVEEPIRFDLEFVKDYPFYQLDNPNNIVLEKEGNQIKYGTLTKIIERLTHHQYADTKSMFTFLATFRTFATPHEVLDLLIWRYNVPPPRDKSPESLQKYKTKMQTPIILRVVNVLKGWIDKHYYDFENDPELKRKLLNFVDGPLAQNPNHQAGLKALIAKKEEQKGAVASVELDKVPPSKLPPVGVDPTTATVLDFDPEEIARQLALINHEVFAAIKPTEFIVLAARYKKTGAVRAAATTTTTPEARPSVPASEPFSPPERAKLERGRSTVNVFGGAGSSPEENLEKLAPNGLKMQLLTNTLKNWVEQEIQIGQENNNLGIVISRLIDIAVWCLKLNNFQSLKTVVYGLEKTYVKELQPVWETVTMEQRKTFFETKELVSRKHALKLREKMHATTPPTVPYLALLLEEIAEIDEKNPQDIINDKMINFQKRHLMGEVICQLQSMQSVPYNFAPVELIQAYLKRTRAPDVDDEAHSSSIGRTSNGSSGSDSQLKYLMLDMLLNDSDFKAEIQDILSEVLREELAKFRDEIIALKSAKDEANGVPSNGPVTSSAMRPTLNASSNVSLVRQPLVYSSSAGNIATSGTPSSPGQVTFPKVMTPPPVRGSGPKTAPTTVSPALTSSSSSPSLPVSSRPTQVFTKPEATPSSSPATVRFAPSTPAGGHGATPSPSTATPTTPSTSTISPPTPTTTTSTSSGTGPVAGPSAYSNPPAKSGIKVFTATADSPVMRKDNTLPGAGGPTNTAIATASSSSNLKTVAIRPTPPPSTTMPATPMASGPATSSPSRPTLQQVLSSSGNRPLAPQAALTTAATISSPTQPTMSTPSTNPTPPTNITPTTLMSPTPSMQPVQPMQPTQSPPPTALKLPSTPGPNTVPMASATPPPPPSNSAAQPSSSLMTMTMTGTPEMQDYGGNYEASGEVAVNAGVDTSRIIESAFAVVSREFPGCILEQWSTYDDTGSVFGQPQNIQISCIKKGRCCYLCDIKPVVNVQDVGHLVKIGKLYRQRHPEDKLACVIITPSITPEAEQIATKCYIKVYKLQL
jgi:hypothetical protein